jgi:hypothetical protein
LALDDFEDRFATAVKLALDASRASGDDKSDAADGAECPPVDAIASYYEYALNRVERARLETHFSGCARCQGTLAALLRAAPAVDTASAAGGFAARGAASESTGIRERWFEISPAWRIAGTTAAAAAMLAVAVGGSVHVFRSRMRRESEPIIALSAASRVHRDESHPSSSNNELALNELKSSVPAAPAAPKMATAPSAGVVSAPIRDASRASSGTSQGTSSAVPSAAAPSASTGEATTSSSTSAEPALPSEEAAPPVAPPNTEQNDATAAAGAQAAAALGALAVTPAPVATTAPSIAAPTAAGSAGAAATPSVTTPPTAAGASAGESKNTSAAIAAAPAAMAGVPGTTAPPSRLQQFQSATVLPAPAIAPGENYRQSGRLTVPAAAGGASALSTRQRAQERFAKDQLAKEQLAEEKRKAELARKADLAKRDANLKRQMALAQRELAAPIPMQIAAAPRAAAQSGVGSNEIAMAERPVASAPAVATMVRGIPVAPHALLISPADHSIYWSLQNSGVIYRSNDRKSWTPVFTAMPAELLAGMAPSDTVCWAVGRKGVILLTTDGIHWARVNSPTASDVIGITAASKDVATIFTAAGVTFSTFDGGSNWTPAN